MDKITRQEAIERGLKRYFTGEACPSGHISERLVSSRACVECKRLKEIGRYARDPEKGLARKKTWRLTNPESEARAKLKYARTHREKTRADHKAWRERNADKIKSYRDKFNLSHPHHSRETTRKYKERKTNAEGSWTIYDIEKLFIEQDGKCNGCGREFSGDLLFETDHIIPLSRDGTSNWPSNLQLLCHKCNLSKGNKTMEEWLA